MTLFKVLGKDGEPIHGGIGHWSLPHDGQPGQWMEIDGPVSICHKGYHAVTQPIRWCKPDATLWVLEPDLAYPMDFDHTEKGCFSRARLLYQVTKDWPLLPMYADVRCFLAVTTGDHSLLAHLSGAYLSRANLSRANLSGAYLPRAYLSGAYLSEAYLSRANLSRANLSGAYLPRANLSGAYLSGANLSGAYLSGAYLSRANLSRANLSGAYRPDNPPPGWSIDKNGYLQKET